MFSKRTVLGHCKSITPGTAINRSRVDAYVVLFLSDVTPKLLLHLQSSFHYYTYLTGYGMTYFGSGGFSHFEIHWHCVPGDSVKSVQSHWFALNGALVHVVVVRIKHFLIGLLWFFFRPKGVDFFEEFFAFSYMKFILTSWSNWKDASPCDRVS